MSDDNLINFQRLQITQLHTNAATAVSNAAMSSIAASHANNNLQNIQEQVRALQSQVEFYKYFLAQPLHVIAAKNNDFKKTYEIQQELLATWMVSQRAFKELAIEFGLVAGKTREEIIDQGITAVKEKVLNNQTKHGNNGSELHVDGRSIKEILKK
jgi:hypothetical protein